MTKTLATVLALAAATPALAQTDPTIPTRDARGGEVVVAASRSGNAVPLDLLAASATVFDADVLHRRRTRIVSDVPRDVPGIAVSRSGGVGGFARLRPRGSESNHVLVLVDGIEVADPGQGEFDFGTLLAHQLTPAVAVFGRVEDLTDERYEEVFSHAMAGRAGDGGVEIRL